MSIDLGSNLEFVYGWRLPIPHVERALVGDSTITATVAFNLVMEEEQDYEDIAGELSDLKFYMTQVVDGIGYNNSHNSDQYTEAELSSGTTRFAKLIDDNPGIMSY